MGAATPFYVSRQSNYYDGGAYSVEIARSLDHSGPGMLVRDHDLHGEGEYEDPREAAQAAVELRKAWRDKTGDPVAITLAMNHYVYPTVADDMPDEQVIKWGEKVYEALPKCDQCGAIAEKKDNYWNQYGDQGTFCCDNCADRYYEEQEDRRLEDARAWMLERLRSMKDATKEQIEDEADKYGWKVHDLEAGDIEPTNESHW